MTTTSSNSTAVAADIVDNAYPAELLAKIEEAKFSSREVSEILLDFQLSVSIADLAKQTRAIVVKDESQKDLMAQARSLRIQLKNERVRLEKARVEKKEPHLRRVQVIDGLSRIVKNWFETEESYLLQQESFAQIKEQERLDARAEDRLKQLLEYNHTDLIPDLGRMPDESFNLILDGAKARFAEQLAQIKKNEEERIQREQEAENLRIENERLQREKDDADRRAREAEAEAQKQRDAAAAAENARLAEIHRQKDEDERNERERIAAEQAEAKRIADEKALANAAPDREKLFLLADQLCEVELPTMSTWEGKALLESFIADREIITSMLRKSAENLRATIAVTSEGDECPF